MTAFTRLEPPQMASNCSTKLENSRTEATVFEQGSTVLKILNCFLNVANAGVEVRSVRKVVRNGWKFLSDILQGEGKSSHVVRYADSHCLLIAQPGEPFLCLLNHTFRDGRFGIIRMERSGRVGEQFDYGLKQPDQNGEHPHSMPGFDALCPAGLLKSDANSEQRCHGRDSLPIEQICEPRPPVPPRRKPTWNHHPLPLIAPTVAIGAPA